MWDMLTWIDGTQFAETIRVSLWIFPALEIAHVAAIAIVLGSIARVDLRLAGLVSRDRSISDISHEMLPWTWASFGLATLFGVLLFVGQPVRYAEIAFFDIKMLLIALAGVNMLVFEYVTLQGFRTLGPRSNSSGLGPPRRWTFSGILDQRPRLRAPDRVRLKAG